MIKRILSLVLIFSLVLTTYMPSVQAAPADTLTVNNGYIEVTASTANGGFVIRTQKGDAVNKDDDNKNLLFRNNDYDTSFTSFQVTKGTEVKEYVFGNNYSFLGLGSANLSVNLESGAIVATQTIDNISFSQRLEPVYNEASNEHGTVKISYEVKNQTGSPINVKARLMLDTALDEQDYAYYEVANQFGGFRQIENEQILTTADYLPDNFVAYNDYENPSLAAYTIKDIGAGAITPYQVAFAHWNSIAATVFDFIPDPALFFTTAYNKRFKTADSAMALYYDLGTVAGGGARDLNVYYGVDSKVRVLQNDKVSIQITAPQSLELSADKKIFLDKDDNPSGKLEITTNIQNLNRPGATRLDNIAIAVIVDDNILPLDSFGNEFDPPPTNRYPASISMDSFAVGDERQLRWNFNSSVSHEPEFRKIEFRAYDMKAGDGLFLMENIIGSNSTYIYCPGGNGKLPEITFTGAQPHILYNKGTRHFYVTGSGFNLLTGKTNYSLVAVSRSNPDITFVIPEENIVFPEPGVMDIAMQEEMPTGDYELSFNWQTPPTGIDPVLTSPLLNFIVSGDTKYKNDSYSVVAIVKEGAAPNWKYPIKAFAKEEDFRDYKQTNGDKLLLTFKGEFTVLYDAGTKEVSGCTAVSTGSNDVVTINDCLDFEKGNIHVYAENNEAKVDFDGKLYTSYSRTSVWTGPARLTSCKNGEDYGLIEYDKDGERTKKPVNEISLVWPSVASMLQTVAGFAVDFRYGQFGVMKDGSKITGYLVSFGGKLDLSFLTPGGSKKAKQNEFEANGISEKDYYVYTSVTSKQIEQQLKDEEEQKKKLKLPSGQVNIADILYGNNKGFVGINMKAALNLPKYLEPLPQISGSLGVNTVGNYTVEVSGNVKSALFSDVTNGLWYSDAVTWAAENGIVLGIGGGLFAPNLQVTREQMAAILYRYEQKSGDIPPDIEENSKFADESRISGYAKDAVNALVAQGIINGKQNNLFDPQGTATRAEVAAMLHRFVSSIISSNYES
ncbi:MAG: S-layer homology domain-containing protein [Clostridiales bacterium]|jgi:hypothetical protein|nr:S-layer homology domain-containing protein [Clostridiales bacterium]